MKIVLAFLLLLHPVEALGENLVPPELVQFQSLYVSGDLKIVNVGNAKQRYSLFCSIKAAGCITPEPNKNYLLIDKNTRWRMPGAKGFITLAFVLRSRLIICALAGIVFGLLAVDTNSRNKSEQYRVWQPVWSIGAGTLIGLVVGFVWDRGTTISEPDPSRKKKSR